MLIELYWNIEELDRVDRL